jgi:hypothetical protein
MKKSVLESCAASKSPETRYSEYYSSFLHRKHVFESQRKQNISMGPSALAAPEPFEADFCENA